MLKMIRFKNKYLIIILASFIELMAYLKECCIVRKRYDFVLKYVVNFLFAKILIKLSGDTLNNLSNNLGSFRRILQGMGIYRNRTFITY